MYCRFEEIARQFQEMTLISRSRKMDTLVIFELNVWEKGSGGGRSFFGLCSLCLCFCSYDMFCLKDFLMSLFCRSFCICLMLVLESRMDANFSVCLSRMGMIFCFVMAEFLVRQVNLI